MTRVLLTNDDGIDAPGLTALAEAIVAGGHDLFIVAPQIDMSGTGASMGSLSGDEPITYEERTLKGLESVPAFALAGTPAGCAILAIKGAFGAPADIVVSGINPGTNAGRAILHSGTVGAALCAPQWGARGLAVSVGRVPPGGSFEDMGEAEYGLAAELGVEVLELMLADEDLGPTISLNVPAVSAAELKGIRAAAPAPYGQFTTGIAEARDGVIHTEYRPVAETIPAGTDAALLNDGYATLTVMHHVNVLDGSALEASVTSRRTQEVA